MKRRLLLAAAAVPATLGRTPAWSAEISLNPENPDHLALIFRKLSFSMNGDLTFWMLHGTRYGLVDNRLTPIWQINIGTWFTVKDLDASDYEVTTMGATFYTDPKTGAFMDTVVNPYSGATHKIPYFPPRPAKLLYAKGEPPPRTGRPGYTITQTESFGPAGIDGDDVWIASDIEIRGQPAAPGKQPYQVHDIATYFGALKDVANPEVKNPPARLTSNDINTFPDYFEMKPSTGTFFSRGLGRKIFRYADMSAAWRELMDRHYPDIARDPAGALKG